MTCGGPIVHYTFWVRESSPPNEPLMADQIVITEKTSQAKDIRAAVGSRYGDIPPAEGHLFDLLEPEDLVPAWKRWSPILLRPEGLYGTRPAEGGNKAAKLKAIREALRQAKRVWLATDCDREGQLIGQEILEHYGYRGQVMRVLFTAQDSQTIRDAFDLAQMRVGAVRAPSAHREFEPQRSLLAKAQRPRTARLAVEATIAKHLRVVFGEVAGSPRPERLLVRYRRQRQPPMQFLAQLLEIEKGEDRGRGAAFHVTSAASVDAAVDQRP